MVRIRLRRVGAKGQPSFRIVAADKESPRDGRFLEILGHYNPRTQPTTLEVQEDRVYHWIGNGAQPSESVVQIFRAAGIWDRIERFKQGEDVELLLAEARGEAPEEEDAEEPEEPQETEEAVEAVEAEVETEIEDEPETELEAAEETDEAEAESEESQEAEADAESETEEEPEE